MMTDQAAVPGGETVTITCARSHMETRWTDQRTLTFDELAKMLSTSVVGQKTGSCYTPATFSGGARRMDQAVRIDMAVLDSDTGATLQDITAALRKQGWRAIVHSTFNHLQVQTSVAAAPAEKWLSEAAGRTVEGYLIEKKGYLPRVARGAKIVNETRDGQVRNLVIEHSPCPKFRVVVPLARPWIAADYPSQQAANTLWRERIGALAHVLGLSHDQSCVDTSRLFYLPRRPAETVFEVEVLPGALCPLFDLPDAPAGAAEAPLLMAAASAPAGQAGAATSPAAAQAAQWPQEVRREHTTAVSDDGQYVDLTAWAAEYARRFQIVEALRAKAPGIFTARRSRGKAHITCPNRGDHITSSKEHEASGTYAVNASDVQAAGLTMIQSGFVLHCMHAGCAGHDRLDHLRAMLADGTLAVEDLTDPRFLLPSDLDGVDLSEFLEKPRLATVADDDEPEAEAEAESETSTKRLPSALRQPNIPPHLYAGLPPIMRQMHEFILEGAAKPQPALALASVLTLCAAAIGRKAELAGWGTRANIYALCVAHSGAGKERLMSGVKQITAAAGLADLVGVEEVASDSGIVTAVSRQPNQVMLIDEIAFLFAATKNSRAGTHMVNVSQVLLRLYSTSRTLFRGKAYADSTMNREVNEPCVSVLGSATPRALFAAMSSADVDGGLLSRFTLFSAGDHDPRGRKPNFKDVPDDIIDWMLAWHQRPLNPNPIDMVGGMQRIAPVQVQLTPEATDIFEAFEDRMHAAKTEARERNTDALYVRARENALKFALVRACGQPAIKGEDGKSVIDESTLVVTGDIARWACELSHITVQTMEASVRDEIADTDFGRLVRDLVHAVRKAGERGLTRRELARNRAGKHPKRVLEDILSHAIESGSIALRNIATAGRKRAAFVHADFFKNKDAGD